MAMTPSDLPDFLSLIRLPLTYDITKEELFEFRAFRDWLNALKMISLDSQERADHHFHQAPYTLRSITIQTVHRFTPTRIGFVTLSANIRNKYDEALPGATMLMILRPSDSENERWAITVEQARILAGSLKFTKILAGMLDDNSDIAAAAADELFEETNFTIPATEPKGLTALTLDKAGASGHLRPAMYPSPGSSDEFIAIFL